jgi:hypothetical protein
LEITFAEGAYGYSMTDFLDELEPLIGSLIELFRAPLTSGDPAPPVTSLL